MLGVTHAAAGGAFAAGLVPPTAKAFGLDFGPEEILVAAGIGTIAGVLPDIDHPNSFITKGVIPGWKKLGPVGRSLGFLLSIPPRIIGVGARATMNHRGGTHSALFMMMWTVLAAPLYAAVFLLFTLLASLVLNVLTGILPTVPALDVGAVADWLFVAVPKVMPLVAMSVFYGYLAHLITDSMTNVPVPWPWPFSKKRFSLLPKGLRITTGSFTEKALIRPIFTLLLMAALAFYVVLPLGEEAVDLGKTQQEAKPAKKRPGKTAPAEGESRYDQP